MDTIDQLKEWLTLRIKEDFGLNSMYTVRIDGEFSEVDAVILRAGNLMGRNTDGEFQINFSSILTTII